jgi:hypothetical protein
MQLIKTSHIFSNIQARDAILINTVIHLSKRNELMFKGTVYSELIKPNDSGTILPFELCFQNIKMFEFINLELSELDSKMESNFMEVKDSEFIREKNLQGFHHYVFSTYDYVYQIIAKTYNGIL